MISTQSSEADALGTASFTPLSSNKSPELPELPELPESSEWFSTIGKKLLTGITGLGLVIFVVVHLLGNLTLFFSASAYNRLAHIIERLGVLTLLSRRRAVGDRTRSYRRGY